MTRTALPLSLLLLLAIAGCTPGTDTEPAAAGGEAASAMQGDYPDQMDAPTREVDPALMAPAAPRPMRGAYVFGHEAETFQECGNPADWWVEGDPAELEPLRRLAREQAERRGDPYQPIHVEATGELLGKDEAAAIPSAFDNVVRLSAVRRAEAELPADCALPTE